jgi:hypothetical protein
MDAAEEFNANNGRDNQILCELSSFKAQQHITQYNNIREFRIQTQDDFATSLNVLPKWIVVTNFTNNFAGFKMCYVVAYPDCILRSIFIYECGCWIAYGFDRIDIVKNTCGIMRASCQSNHVAAIAKYNQYNSIRDIMRSYDFNASEGVDEIFTGIIARFRKVFSEYEIIGKKREEKHNYTKVIDISPDVWRCAPSSTPPLTTESALSAADVALPNEFSNDEENPRKRRVYCNINLDQETRDRIESDGKKINDIITNLWKK